MASGRCRPILSVPNICAVSANVGDSRYSGARDHHLWLRLVRPYEKAYDCYKRYLYEVQHGVPDAEDRKALARTPERIKIIVPLLRDGIEEEKKGVAALGKSLEAMGVEVTPQEPF